MIYKCELSFQPPAIWQDHSDSAIHSAGTSVAGCSAIRPALFISRSRPPSEGSGSATPSPSKPRFASATINAGKAI